ncbi:serine/threonine protein kinase [Actinoplanes sp. LDG1-06]|uniref:non-specific serine/threonine protein kinase n=1 Tax=Paractinoplanes ovalisporus TaxID=2810368 RepID=A0ABS2ADF1_9ACTN|nr:serine/threonine-protein kinase [Actinoplanes ovalisporus]MBM2617863.1 serine/threonine protein kinase [Actinoplanes ovalisporus]
MPSKIGRYRVERRLGAGAFATVWLAEDEALESWVAIKVLADNWSHHPDVRARFEQEAQILRRADSERLVRVLDIGELPDGRPYLVMTYADGGTLAERIEAGPLPITAAVAIALDITRAVAVLHDSGVLHRDLKPSNVLFHTVRGRRRVLVADLGLAKEIAHASGFTVVAGTPGYMAPEQQVPGGGLDVRADVHAIGAMLFQMLTGRTPRKGGTAPGKGGTAPGKGGSAPSKLRPGVRGNLDRVVQRALETDPARRWPTAAALADALEGAAAPPPAPRRWPLRVVGVAVASAAVLATGSAALAQPTAEGWQRVTDASGVLSVAVPASWAHQFADGGWDPAAVGLPAGRSPGLAVGVDLTDWANPSGTSPGVFAGLSDAASGAVLPPHNGCARAPDRRIVIDGLTGRVQRWTGCGGTSTSYSEVVLSASGGRGVYLQIRQDDPGDRTDEVLRGVRIIRSSRTSSTGARPR